MQFVHNRLLPFLVQPRKPSKDNNLDVKILEPVLEYAKVIESERLNGIIGYISGLNKRCVELESTYLYRALELSGSAGYGFYIGGVLGAFWNVISSRTSIAIPVAYELIEKIVDKYVSKEYQPGAKNKAKRIIQTYTLGAKLYNFQRHSFYTALALVFVGLNKDIPEEQRSPVLDIFGYYIFCNLFGWNAPEVFGDLQTPVRESVMGWISSLPSYILPTIGVEAVEFRGKETTVGGIKYQFGSENEDLKLGPNKYSCNITADVEVSLHIKKPLTTIKKMTNGIVGDDLKFLNGFLSEYSLKQVTEPLSLLSKEGGWTIMRSFIREGDKFKYSNFITNLKDGAYNIYIQCREVPELVFQFISGGVMERVY